MDRKVVEAMLARCEKFPGDELRLVKQSTLAALCRTQLAVWDAHSSVVEEGVEFGNGVEVRFACVDVPVEMIGQRVRIVPDGA